MNWPRISRGSKIGLNTLVRSVKLPSPDYELDSFPSHRGFSDAPPDGIRSRLAVWQRGALIIIAIPLLALILAPLVLTWMGHWLVISDPLQPARAVVVFGGQVPFRAMEAASIFHKGLVLEVWLTQGAVHEEDIALERLGIQATRENEYSRRVLERLGVPAGSIRLLEGGVENTSEEVGLIAHEMRRVGGGRVILITSKSHTRRVRVIWQKLVGRSPQAIIRYTPADPYDPDRWWGHPRDSFAVTREVGGLLNALFGFPMQPSN